MEVGDVARERLQRDRRRRAAQRQRRIGDGHRERQRRRQAGRIGDDDRARVRHAAEVVLGERVADGLPVRRPAVVERPGERQAGRPARAEAASRPGADDAQLDRVALGAVRRDRVHRDGRRGLVRQQVGRVLVAQREGVLRLRLLRRLLVLLLVALVGHAGVHGAGVVDGASAAAGLSFLLAAEDGLVPAQDPPQTVPQVDDVRVERRRAKTGAVGIELGKLAVDAAVADAAGNHAAHEAVVRVARN